MEPEPPPFVFHKITYKGGYFMSDLTSGLLQETVQSSFRIPVFLSYATVHFIRMSKFQTHTI